MMDFSLDIRPKQTGGSEQDVEARSFSARQQKLLDALALMEEALQLLDEADTSGNVDPHLDLAICRLRDMLPQSRPDVIPPQSGPPAKCTE